MRPFKNTAVLQSTLSCFIVASMLVSAQPAQAQISQAPLLLGGGGVPGSLALVPSVEYPTVISVANIGAYNHASNYVGYFDPAKCYIYKEETFTHVFFGEIKGADGGGYFTPTRFARNCNKANEWSGNYLNWASTQTIDAFRKALTGGYRSVDTASQTILEKATRGNRNEYFRERFLAREGVNLNTNANHWRREYRLETNSQNITPFSNQTSITSTVYEGATGTYKRNKTLAVSTWDDNTRRHYSVRVEVCKKDLLESNCVAYGNSWKPEGLLQQYADTIRYSAFSYVNEDGNTRNGGVLRAQQDYIGQRSRTPGTSGQQANANAEWNATTGVIRTNPHDATEGNSGVLNYINKFGELTNQHKSNDPVSELYYTALRYFKNQGDVAAYSNITNDAQRDKFPVLTDWNDPIIYACQKNVILGIGDVNTHNDHDVPAPDDTLDVNAWTQAVFTLEGITTAPSAQFTGRGNSAHIAGLAYYANTTDLRADKAGQQTVSTHWVDVREDETLLSRKNNQYWLAGKYGGFKVPESYTRGTALQNAWWRSNETLSTGDRRPNNFYVASDAENMVRSLELAFAQIAEEMQSTLNTVASNSTRLETDTAIFQSSLNNRHWSGDLVAKRVGTNGAVSTTASWSAAARLDALSSIDSRNIFTSSPLAAGTDPRDGLKATSAVEFKWGSLDASQRQALMTTAEITANNATVAEQRLAYLRGDRSQERTITDQEKLFRQRGSRLGDIVNSDPQYVGKQDFGYRRLVGTNWTDARDAYSAFQTAKQNRTELIVFGANDGMLHGVKAGVESGSDGGSEVFAFIPNSVFNNLRLLAEPSYSHRYYVDGTPRVADAWVGNAWKTLVAGTTGAGGNSVFLLDITDTANIGRSKFLWEFTHPDMGRTIGQPAIVALPSGKFAVVVTSGYHNSPTTSAKVWFLDVANGNVLHTIDIATEGSLGSPLLADLDYDMVSDRLYVGDTLGNLWSYNLTSTGASNSIPGGAPLFVAVDAANNRQPITAPLASAFDEQRRHVVLFGTGSFIREGDNEVPTNPPIQTFYGIIDAGAAVARSSLLKQEILVEKVSNQVQARGITQNSMDGTHQGWYLDLAWTTGTGATGAKGERVVSKPSVRSDRVLFTSMIPDADPCASGGRSWIMALNLSTGGRLNYAYFDTNKDNAINGDDLMDHNGVPIPPSGISDPDDGVIKGAAPLYRWLCYAGSGGTPKCIQVATSQRVGRNSWQEEQTK